MNPKSLIVPGALAWSLLLAGCSQQGADPADPAESAAPATPAIDLADPATTTYTVLGTVAALPDPAKPASEFQIAHEEIPDFVGSGGDVVGMKAMTMPFPLAPGVSLDGLAIGDAVTFTFAVNWNVETGHPWMLTAIEKTGDAPTP